MELRWILVGVTVVVIAALLFDALRRSKARTPAAPPAPAPVRAPRADDEVDFNPELPSGRARVIRREPVPGSMAQAPAQTPALTAPAARTEPPLMVEPAPAEPPRAIEQVDMFGDLEIPAAQPAAAREIRERGELPSRDAPPREPARAAAQPEKPKKVTPEEVVVVHVMGGEARLDGRRLLQAVLDCGLRFGEYNIFHRYESGAHDARAMFSMASAVEPGVFDLDTMESQTFVGVSFFLMLPGPANSRQALDTMIEAARRVARDTGGELHDQQHSVLTTQTIEHLRQRVMEYERRRLAAQRANG